MTTPECTCTPFVFADAKPWMVGLHANDCPRLCTCYYRSGMRLGRGGQIVHLADCGWYEPPKSSESVTGKIKGVRPLHIIMDEGLSE